MVVAIVVAAEFVLKSIIYVFLCNDRMIHEITSTYTFFILNIIMILE